MTAGKTGRKPGRPRAFADEDVFLETTRLLLDGGISSVTLQRVAAAVGTSHQAISQRFESKSGLLRACYAWLHVRFDAYNAIMTGAHESPLATIRARFMLGTGVARPDEPVFELYAVPLMLELRKAPEVLRYVQSLPGEFEPLLVGLLDEAQQVGELLPCNSVDLAALITAASIGGVVAWRLNPDVSILDLMDRYISTALRPYLTDRAPVWR